MPRHLAPASAAALYAILCSGCAPSLGGLAATSDRGGDRTTVVNPTLSLTAPAAFVGSSKLTIASSTTPAGLDIEGSLDGGPFQRVGGSWLITGLADGAHEVRLRVAGAAASVQTATFTTDTIAPSAPTGITVAAAAGRLAVTWTAGSDGGSGLADYTVAYGTTSGALSTQVETTAPATGVDLTSVSSCQTYHVTVTCTDRAGNTSTTTSEVSCRANCGGDGTFTTQSTSLGLGVSTVAKGDFDGDGILDLAVDADDHLQILLGNGADSRGTGTFTASSSIATGSTIAEIVVADVDADRIADVVLVNETHLRVYKGQGTEGRGDGTFVLHSSVATNLNTPQALLVRDVDADAIPDAIVGDWGSNALLVFTGNGTGGRGTGAFTYSGFVATGAAPGAIAAGDFNADGIADLAVACQSGTEVLVTHLGNGTNGRGNGTFAAMQTWLSGGFVAGDVLVTDHNGDGIDDLVATLALANAVCFLAGSGSGGRGTGTFYLDEVVGTGTRPWGLIAGDFTGDGIPDYASLSYLLAGVTLIEANGTHGRGDGTFTTSTPGGSGLRMFRGIAGDVDGNGSPDLVVGDLDGGFAVLRATGRKGVGDGTFAGRHDALFGLGTVFGLGIADRDSDRVPDLMVASFQTPYAGGSDFVITYLNPETLGLGSGDFDSGTLTTTGSGPTAFAFGDFDRDRILDTAVLASDLDARGGGNRVDVLLGSGSNGVGDGGVGGGAPVSVGATPRAIATGDFNADAIPDLAVCDHADDTVTILIGQGTGGRGNGTFTAQTPIAAGTGPFAIATGDFDADGILDLAIGNVTGSGTGAVRILTGQGSDGAGDGTFAAGAVTTTTFAVTGLAAGDFDGDGITDLAAAMYRFGGATAGSGFVVFTGNGSDGAGDGTFTAGSEIAIGGNPFAIVAGDWNHDGALDLAVSRTDAAFVAVLLGGANDGRGDGTFAAPVAIAVDTAGTALAVADLDCDGVLDLVNGGGERVSIRFGGGTF